MFTLMAAAVAFAQAPEKEPEITVVSVKPADPGTNAMNNRFPPGRFTLIGYTLLSLIESAYSVREYQVIGGPGWMNGDRWTMEGELSAPIRMFANMSLLQPVLADRFQLRVRHETRSMPVYSLVVAKSGPKLKAAESDAQQGTRYGDQIVDKKYDIRRLAQDLGGNLNVPVTDKTGLTGIYNMDLKWTADPATPFGDVRNGAELPAPDPNRPEIFTAIKDQLGLELKSEKGPVDVIVIERAERPMPN